MIRLTAADVRRIRQQSRPSRRGPGTPFAHLAAELGVHVATVAAAAYGVTWRQVRTPPIERRAPTGRQPAGTRLTTAMVARLRRRYVAGEPLSRIAADVGVAPGTAWQAVHGLTWRDLHDPPPVPRGTAGRRESAANRARIVELHQRGLSQTEIAQRVKVDKSTVSRALRAALA